MLLWLFLGLAVFYGIRAATAKTEEDKERLEGRAKNNLIGAGVVFVIAIILSIALASSGGYY